MNAFVRSVVLGFAALFFALVAQAQASQSGSAQQNQMVLVDINQLPPELRAKLDQQGAYSTISEWAGLGKEVGEAFNGGLSALRENVVEFGDTRVGNFTMAIIAWKVAGKDVIDLIKGPLFGFPAWILSTCVLIWSYRRMCLSRTVLVENSKSTGKKWQVVRPPLEGGDLQGAALIHGVIWCLGSLLIGFQVF